MQFKHKGHKIVNWELEVIVLRFEVKHSQDNAWIKHTGSLTI